MKNLKVKPEIMKELIESPGVKENYDKMTKNEKRLFRKLLVDQGIYRKFVKEKEVNNGV